MNKNKNKKGLSAHILSSFFLIFKIMRNVQVRVETSDHVVVSVKLFLYLKIW